MYLTFDFFLTRIVSCFHLPLTTINILTCFQKGSDLSESGETAAGRGKRDYRGEGWHGEGHQATRRLQVQESMYDVWEEAKRFLLSSYLDFTATRAPLAFS